MCIQSGTHFTAVVLSVKSELEGRSTIKVRILGKVLQVSEMLVPDRKRGLQMSILLHTKTP